ncbi:hypothetical protein B4O97_15265 [Marispirochaeta aestuarii]|uniref:Uncharacterized protein n=1 Tax=Marispirochaeta aestuarii TaxID=1963862 RepID=A0A1Y1RW28_9SPIO|nr:zf-HC2 domain-containing protein [Marispirochaeta aestuarii]ORC32811.1 hypothetical protein B4O97_15265 [Marispirochaeta aestuarii]
MCPDKETISAYIDGELEQGWNETLGSHMENCPACSREVSQLRGLTRIMHTGDSVVEDALETARHRVWRGVRSSCEQRTYHPFPFRVVKIPVPTMALIAVLCLVMGAGTMMLWTGGYMDQGGAVAAIPEDHQFTSTEELLEYLSRHEKSLNITIQLPEEPVFLVLGEPQLLRAADYRQGE